MTKECVVCHVDVTKIKPVESLIFYTMYQSVDVAILRGDAGATSEQLRKRKIHYICEKCRGEGKGNWLDLDDFPEDNGRFHHI